MGVKIYIGFSLLLIILVGVIGYGVQPGEYEVTISDYSLKLPIIAWVLAPLVLLFIFSVLHLVFYGSLNYCKNRGFTKDEATIIETIKSLLLQKQDKKKFKTTGYKNIAGILNQFNVDVKDAAFTSSNESLNQTVSQIKDIKAGRYVNEKNLKLDVNSDLAKQNLLNKMAEQPDFSLDVLKKGS